jgi:hypothetical protein
LRHSFSTSAKAVGLGLTLSFIQIVGAVIIGNLFFSMLAYGAWSAAKSEKRGEKIEGRDLALVIFPLLFASFSAYLAWSN